MTLDFYKGKRVFITGHTGFKGSWLSRVLVNAGARVIGYSLDPPTVPSLFEILELSKDMQSLNGDIRDGEKLEKAMQTADPEIVFHMAAQPIVREGYKNPVYTYETNVMGTVNILEAARHATNLRSVVNVTTDKVYKNKEWAWGYRENENLCGFDPYSNSKSCSELVTHSYINSFFIDENSPSVSTARSGNVIGGGDFAPDRIIPDCIRAAEKGEDIVMRNPHSTRPYQYVLECLSGYLVLAQKQWEDKRLAGSYNFGPRDECCVSTGVLVKIFCDAWGNGIKYRTESDGGPHEANFLKLDISKAALNLEWKPKWEIKTAIEKVVSWQKSYIENEAKSITDLQLKAYFE